MLFARQNSLPFQSHPQQSVRPQAPTGSSARQAVVVLRGASRIAKQPTTERRSPGAAMATSTENCVVRATARHYGVSTGLGKRHPGTHLADSGTLARESLASGILASGTLASAGAGCRSSRPEGPEAGAERFAAKRNRHALELLGACMMIASFLVLALFA